MTGPGRPILMYHSVDDGPVSDAFARYVVTPRQLESHLDALATAGYRTVGLTELHTAPAGARVVGLTFDDGFRDFHDAALPILERYDARASLFVATGYLGTTARWLDPEGESGRPMIDSAQLAAIADSGRVEVGSHTHSHACLDTEDAVRVRSELALARTILEQHLQSEIRTIAYPFGYYNHMTLRLARAVGYQGGCCVSERTSAGWDDPLALPRWSVYPTTSVAKLLDLVKRPATPATRVVSEAKRHIWRFQRRFAGSPRVAPSPPPPLPDIDLRDSALARPLEG